MILAIDVGNTNIVLGLFDGEDLVDAWRVRTSPRITGDELGFTVRGLLGAAVAGVDAVAVASVVPSVTRAVVAMCGRLVPDVRVHVVGPGVRTGVPLLVDNPREIGADRVVDALAAWELFGGPCLVVGLGTAIRIDAVSARGEFLGGVIAPGIEVGVEALAARAASLRLVDLEAPRRVVGKNTVEALQSGVVLGAAAMVDGLVGRMLDELAGGGRFGVGEGEDVPVIATGALASLVVEESRRITDHEPDLRLEGLRIVAERAERER